MPLSTTSRPRLVSHIAALVEMRNRPLTQGLPKVYGVSGVAVLYFLLVFLNLGGIGQLLANFATLVVPGYYSILAIESPGHSDDTHYLTYWVVYAFFSVIEFWSRTILYWVPFYWVFKTIFFLYLSLPFYNGSRWIYTTVIRPLADQLGIRSSSSSLKEALKDE